MSHRTIRVLLIEDNVADARLIRELLEEEPSTGFQLERVDRLQAGLDRLAQGNIDVILLDLMLPDSRGFETFEKVRDRAPHVPIVVLTGLEDEQIALETLHSGGQDCLTKGILVYTLLHRLIRHAIVRQSVVETKLNGGNPLGHARAG